MWTAQKMSDGVIVEDMNGYKAPSLPDAIIVTDGTSCASVTGVGVNGFNLDVVVKAGSVCTGLPARWLRCGCCAPRQPRNEPHGVAGGGFTAAVPSCHEPVGHCRGPLALGWGLFLARPGSAKLVSGSLGRATRANRRDHGG